MIKSTLLFFVLIMFISGVSGQVKSQAALEKVSLIPQWYPQAQFAGYYMAYEKGIYKRYGLDVTIISGGPENPPTQLLTEGKAHFSTTWLSSSLQNFSHGIKLVNIAQIIQKSALMFITTKSSGIKSPEDMNGKKVSVWSGDFQLQPVAFIDQFKLKVNYIEQRNSLNLFLRGGVDVISAMWYNEYHTILNSGYNPDELNTFFFYDYDLNFPEDGIYCMAKTYTENPRLCEKFVRASLEGWQYAFDHPEMTLDVIIRYKKEQHLPVNRPHQRWMLNRMKDIIIVEGVLTGRLYRDDYLRVANELKKRQLIKEIPEFSSFYKECIRDDKK